MTFVSKIMSLLFNTLSKFIKAFLPRDKSLLISWLHSPSVVILEPKKIKSVTFPCFPIYMPWSNGTGCLDFSFLLSAIRMLSSASLGLLMFLPIILIPACTSSSPASLMMYSAYRLNKQGANIQPWRTPFPIWSQSIAPCPVLAVASWPAYSFLKRQVRWSGNLPYL